METDMSDNDTPPSDADVRKLVGDAYSHFTALVERIEETQGKLSLDWKFYKPTGWFMNGVLKRKRVFLFIPRENGFIFRMVFNDRAVEMIRQADLPAFIARDLDAAKQYPEGRPFDLDQDNFDLDTACKLIELKLQSTKAR